MEKYSEKIIELTKQSLEGNDVIEELKKELEKELTPSGKLSKLYELLNENKLDMEKYEFILKLISKDPKLYEQISKLEKLKATKKMQTDLETLAINLEETKETLKQQVNSLNISTTPKTNIPVLKTLQKRKLERKNKDILKTKFDLIISTIEQSKSKAENKELKEEYCGKEGLKTTLDLLYKHCELGNIEEINKLEIELDKKYKKILDAIKEDIKKYADKYKEKRKETESFDQRLRKYVFNKENNYVTAAIDRWSKKNYINYNSETKNLKIEIPEEEQESIKLIVYGLVGLYQINKNNTNKFNITLLTNSVPKKLSLEKQAPIKKIDNHKKKK